MIYYDTTAIDAVNNDTPTPDAFYHPKHPSQLIAVSKYIKTDAWRGHTEIVPEPGFKLLDSDWVTDDWDDAIAAVHGATPQGKRLEALEQEYGDLIVIYTPTSNVFSTGQDILVPDPDTPIVKGKTIAHKTKRFDYPNGDWSVRYHATHIVRYNAHTKTYTLDTGGWNTMTTAKRMTEALPSGWCVSRRNWVMYVTVPGIGELGLKDGMQI